MANTQRPRVDEEDDLDDLDDVLDQFSGPPALPTTQAQPTSAVASTSADLQAEDATDREFAAAGEGAHLEGMSGPPNDQTLPSEFTAQMEAFLKYLQNIGPEEGAAANDSEFAAAWEAARVEGTSGPANNQSSTGTSAGSKQDDFQSRIRSTMNKLKESESGLKSSDSATSMGGDALDLESMLSQLGLSGAEDGVEDEAKLQGMLEQMMGQLMSKEILYEPLKELDEKFPEYLSKNRSTILPQDKERFEAQRSCIKRLLVEFEAPGYKDDDEETQKKIVDLMGELQSHGSPPEEIMGPLPPGFNMGTDGLPDMPDDCKVN